MPFLANQSKPHLRRKLNSIIEERKVLLQQIQAHSSIIDSEIVDELAKDEATIAQQDNVTKLQENVIIYVDSKNYFSEKNSYYIKFNKNVTSIVHICTIKYLELQMIYNKSKLIPKQYFFYLEYTQ